MSQRQRRSSLSSRIALSTVSREAQQAMLQECLDKGKAFINTLDEKGFTPLHRACAAPNSEGMVAELINAGADVNQKDLCGDTPLHWGVFCNNAKTVKILLENGADPRIPNTSGKTVAMIARDEGEKSMLELLEPNLADANPPAPTPGLPGAPPETNVVAAEEEYPPSRRMSLATAASQGDVVLVRAALDAGRGEINGLDADGFTPLHRASALPNSEAVVLALIQAGADVEVTDSFGDTALHWASFCGHSGSVEILLNHGASTTTTNIDGKTPMDAAEEEGHADIINLIQTHKPPPKGTTAAAKAPTPPNFQLPELLKESLKVKTKQGLLRTTRWPMRMCVIDSKRGEFNIYPASSGGGKNLSTALKSLLYVREHATKNVGLRFEVAVLSGKVYSFVAESEDQQKKWMNALRAAGGKTMPTNLIQRQVRRFLKQRKYRKIMKERGFATKLLSTTAHMSLSDMVKKDLEGPLSKRDDKKHGRVARLFRNRYFVLSHAKGCLLYYDNKAKRNLNYKPRKIEIKTFLSVRSSKLKGGKQLFLSVTSGRVYELLASSPAKAKEWVNTLQATLPAENFAAYKIQANVRGMLIRRKFKVVLDKHRETLRITAEKKAAELKAIEDARLQKLEEDKKNAEREAHKKEAEKQRIGRFERLRKLREEAARQKMLKEEEGKAAELAAAAAKKKQEEEAKKRHEEEAKKRQEEEVQAKAAAAAPSKDGKTIQIWVHAYDAPSDKDYYFNEITKETTWALPEGDGPWVWVAKHDESSNQVYYINMATHETSWTRPLPPGETDEAVDPDDVPENWRLVTDVKTGRKYFVNTVSKKSSWDRPACLMFGWAAVSGENGKTYYFNPTTNETSWSPPPLPFYVTGEEQEAAPSAPKIEAAAYDEDEKVALGSMLEDLELSLADEFGTASSFDSWIQKCTQEMLYANVLNHFFPDAIDVRALNARESGEGDRLDLESMVENIQLYIGAAKSVGAVFPNVATLPTYCAAGDPWSCIEFVYPLMHLVYAREISITKCPVMVLLKGESNEDEEDEDTIRFMKSSTPGEILLRWINYHAYKSDEAVEARASNFGSDLQDGALLLNILKRTGSREIVEEETVVQSIISTLRQRNLAVWMKPRYIEGGKERVLTLLCCALFSADTGLSLSDMSEEAVEKAQMLEEEDPSQTKEHRTYKMWLNSLVPYIEGQDPVIDIVEDLRNGFNLTNVGGLDILDCKNPKLLYALLFKCLRYHSLMIVTNANALVTGSAPQDGVNEDEIIYWANEKCEENGCSGDLESFSDRDLANSVFFMDLLEALEPGVVDWDVLRGVEAEEDRRHNAQYVISVARKLGCPVFITWEDIVKVNRHMLMTFTANLMVMDLTKENSEVDQLITPLTKEMMRIKS
eukprot:g6389.t1